jgi:TnpA family transposase
LKIFLTFSEALRNITKDLFIYPEKKRYYKLLKCISRKESIE